MKYPTRSQTGSTGRSSRVHVRISALQEVEGRRAGAAAGRSKDIHVSSE